MKIVITILLLTISMNLAADVTEFVNEEDNLLVQRIVNPELISLPVDTLPIIDLKVDTLNSYWNQLSDRAIGESLKLDTVGSSYIEFSKVTDKAMSLRVYYADPNRRNDSDYQMAYTARYRWIRKFNTLVAVSCRHEPPKIIEPPQVEYECEYGVELAANVIKVAVSANISSIEDGNYNKLAECVKEKTVKFERTGFHNCFISTMENSELARAALREKVTQLKAEGYICDENNNCRTEVGRSSNEKTSVIETKKLEGDEVVA